jgi:phosphatidylglycerol:prolipoprotein diacylglycerol transferase
MIPYLRLPDMLLVPARALGNAWPASDIEVHPFGLLVALGVWLGVWLTLRYCRNTGLSAGAGQGFLLWVIGGGFIGGHVFELVFYCPECIVGDPLALLRVWQGQSSIGGFLGAAVGVFAWRKSSGIHVRPYVEAAASSFPAAWFCGRVGCAVVHDHPGRLSSAWWAVAYPGAPRLDMGLLEAAVTLPLALGFLWLRRRPRPAGLFLGLMCTYYTPLRFVLDFLRARDIPGADARYMWLTPAQWGCLALGVLGVHQLVGANARRIRKARGQVTQPELPAC